MRLEDVGDILVEFIPLIIIIDKDAKIVWNSDQIKGRFNIGPDELDLEDKFHISIDDLEKHSKIRANIHGSDYIITIKNIFCEEQEYILLLLQTTEIFENKDLTIFALEQIIEKISDGILVSDQNGKIVIYNNSMEKLEDKRSADMVEKYLWDAYEYDGVDNSEHRRVFHSGKPVINKYAAHAYNHGIPKYVSYSTYPIKVDNEILGVYSISKNETKLHTLLEETVELKRQFQSGENTDESRVYKSNGTTFTFADIIGSSDEMKRLIKEAQSISWVDNNVLIVGDTGTGKEVFAQSIHNYGKRMEKPFIGINCSAIPENLLESILFGTVKGAYTGALDHTGLFEEAKGGTLFLDELSAMPISMQAKLLRVLQERRVRPVGGNDTYPIHCRIISAMNENPNELIKKGRLREDLFYRIAGFNLYIPPLCERKKDIFDLADFYISDFNASMDKNITGLSRELKGVMTNYTWPGNVRELQHFIENIMVRVDEEYRNLIISDIPEYIRSKIISSNSLSSIIEEKGSLPEILNNLEKKIILETLEMNDWNVSKSARDLGIIRQSLIYRIKKLDIERNKDE